MRDNASALHAQSIRAHALTGTGATKHQHASKHAKKKAPVGA